MNMDIAWTFDNIIIWLKQTHASKSLGLHTEVSQCLNISPACFAVHASLASFIHGGARHAKP